MYWAPYKESTFARDLLDARTQVGTRPFPFKTGGNRGLKIYPKATRDSVPRGDSSPQVERVPLPKTVTLLLSGLVYFTPLGYEIVICGTKHFNALGIPEICTASPLLTQAAGTVPLASRLRGVGPKGQSAPLAFECGERTPLCISLLARF